MSLKLTTSLSQRLVLTPQLRQRIEMLQMTTLELTDLIQQQLLENPVLEEVATQEEARELAEKILDHLATPESANTFDQIPGEPAEMGMSNPSSNGAGDAAVAGAAEVIGEADVEGFSADGANAAESPDEMTGEEISSEDS